MTEAYKTMNEFKKAIKEIAALKDEMHNARLIGDHSGRIKLLAEHNKKKKEFMLLAKYFLSIEP